MNVPEDCKHSSKFKKDCCEVIWNGTIVESDGCVTIEGCDLVVYNSDVIAFIEIKSGTITSSDAKKIVKQIDFCKNYYNDMVGYKKRYLIFVHCTGKKRKRIDLPARNKLKRHKIIIKDCRRVLNLII